MAKKQTADIDSAPAATPPRQEEPLSGAIASAPDTPALIDTCNIVSNRLNLDSIVDGWFNDCIKGGEIGRHTQSFNHLMGALDELKRRLNRYTTREN